MKKIEISFSHCDLVHPGSAIYLITTIGKSGISNIAPYGMVMSVSYNPLTYAIGSDKDRDTYRNILQTKEFVLNMPDTSLVKKIDICATKFPEHISEFHKAKLTPISSVKVTPPRILECKAHIECRLIKIINLNKNEVIILGKAISLSLNSNLKVKEFSRQKGMLDPVFAVRPEGRWVYYFSLGKFIARY